MKNTEIPYPQRTIRILNAIIRKMESPYSNTYEYVKNVKRKLEKELKDLKENNEI